MANQENLVRSTPIVEQTQPDDPFSGGCSGARLLDLKHRGRQDPISLNLIRAIAVAAHIVTEAHLPRMQLQFGKCVLQGSPYAIVTAAVAPRAQVFGVVLRRRERKRSDKGIHREVLLRILSSNAESSSS